MSLPKTILDIIKVIHDKLEIALEKDKMLSISIEKPLLLVERVASGVQAIHKRLEPLQNGKNERTLRELYAQSPTLLAWVDAFRTFDWKAAFPCLELAIKQMKYLSALA